jgi:inosine-uridine nucleoside N-ribohydrolase
VPSGKIDVVLDTDAFNEVDDQFAISYLLKYRDRFNVKGLLAAPFLNAKSVSAGDGMEKSYAEILKLLSIMGLDDLNNIVYKGSEEFLRDEATPTPSPAADFLAALANEYSPENPLYVVAIGAITNIASAIITDPSICENIVVVFLGGHALHFHNTNEFNMKQDVAAARVIYKCDAPYVQLPCLGVVSEFRTSGPELDFWLSGKTELSDYLSKNTQNEANSYANGKVWSRVIWDVTAVAWLTNDNGRFMASRIIDAPMPLYDNTYDLSYKGKPMRYVYFINRDSLMADLFAKLTRE